MQLRKACPLLASSLTRSHMAIVQHNDVTVGIVTLDQVALMYCRPAVMCNKKCLITAAHARTARTHAMRLFVDARIHCALQVIQVMFGHPVIDEHAARMDKHKIFVQSQPNTLRPNLNMQARVLAPRECASAVAFLTQCFAGASGSVAHRVRAQILISVN